jgi:hypothetical protein
MPTISLLVTKVKIFQCVLGFTDQKLILMVITMLFKVWDRHTFTHKTSLRGHTGSILALELAEEKCWLFSASGGSSRAIIYCLLTTMIR